MISTAHLLVFAIRPQRGMLLSDTIKTAIIGATGFVGTSLLNAYRIHHPDTLGTTRRADLPQFKYLDLRRPDLRRMELLETGHHHAIILAAEPNVSRCESRPIMSRSVNVEGTLMLVDQLLKQEVFPIFVSSDYVFDGAKGNYTEDEACEPTTLYGRQKREVELALLERSKGECLIVRLSKMYSLRKGDGLLLDEMAANLATGQSIRVARDQVFSPMFLEDLAPALQAAQRAGARGVLHMCGDETRSRLTMARDLALAMAVDPELVVAISLDEMGLSPRRPKNTSMNNSRLRQLYTNEMLNIQRYTAAVAANYRTNESG